MSQWKRMQDFEQRLPDLTVEELRELIQFRSEHAQLLQPKIRRLAGWPGQLGWPGRVATRCFIMRVRFW